MAVVKKQPLARIKLAEKNPQFIVLTEHLYNTLEKVVPTRGNYVSTF